MSNDILEVKPHPQLVIREKQGFLCLECEAFFTETGPALYECGECGNVFNKDAGNGRGNMCPNCGKTSSKLADQSCAECQEGEVGDMSGFVCNFCEDEMIIAQEDFLEHLSENHSDDLASLYLELAEVERS